MDEHRQNLGSLCRICTKKLGRVSYSIQQKAALVEECFHISVSSDNPDIHPGRFCNSCKLTMRRMTNAHAKGAVYRTSLELHSTWEDHQEEGCSTCGMVAGRKIGGRPKKKAAKHFTMSGCGHPDYTPQNKKITIAFHLTVKIDIIILSKTWCSE